MKIRVSMDVGDWSLREIDDYEEATGLSYFAFQQGKPPSGRQLSGMAWIQGRRIEPDLTYEEVRNLTGADLEFVSPPAEAGPGAATASANGSRPSATSTAASRRTRSGV